MFSAAQQREYLIVAAAVVATTILVRIAWIMLYNQAMALKNAIFGVKLARASMTQPTWRTGLLVSWCGMRGTVTVAAALALPPHFPRRELIILTAFAVTLSTLVVQGLTLRPLIAWLKLPPDDTIAHELGLARAEGLKVALAAIAPEHSAAARLLRREYREALGLTEAAENDRPDTEVNALRRRAIEASRARIIAMRDAGEVGDDAFRTLEAEYDLIELAARDPDEVVPGELVPLSAPTAQ